MNEQRAEWLTEVKALFDNREDGYWEASELYSFETAYDDGLTPIEAIADYDEWISA